MWFFLRYVCLSCISLKTRKQSYQISCIGRNWIFICCHWNFIVSNHKKSIWKIHKLWSENCLLILGTFVYNIPGERTTKKCWWQGEKAENSKINNYHPTAVFCGLDQNCLQKVSRHFIPDCRLHLFFHFFNYSLIFQVNLKKFFILAQICQNRNQITLLSTIQALVRLIWHQSFEVLAKMENFLRLSSLKYVHYFINCSFKSKESVWQLFAAMMSWVQW